MSAACGHTVPAFGCVHCLHSDREAFAAKTYSDWKKTYRLPKCPSCGKPMLHYGFHSTKTEVIATVICSGHDKEGVPTCEDEDREIVIG